MRLIDADAFNDWVLSHFEEPQSALILTLQGFIAEQPTAYDIDKVVEDLESYRNEITCDIDIDNAIEIVKQGGISDDVCEWKLKDVCYTSSIKHYDALPTSIVKTFTSCHYCGKKIKVVE